MYKIMIVEDEPPIARYLCRLLEKYSDRYTIAAVGSNGQEGLDLFREYRPDIVITDVRMPMMSGLEMIRAIKELDSKPRFLIISDYQDFEYARDGLSLGVHNYLIKPVTSEQIRENLEHIRAILEQEEQRTGKQALQDLIMGKTDTEAVREMDRTAAVWQLLLIQKGCLAGSRIWQGNFSEENRPLEIGEARHLFSGMEHVVYWSADRYENRLVCLINAEESAVDSHTKLNTECEDFWTVVYSGTFQPFSKGAVWYAQSGRELYRHTVIGENQLLSCEKAEEQAGYALTEEQEVKIREAAGLGNFDLLRQELISIFAEMERRKVPQIILENQLQRFFFQIESRRRVTVEQQQEDLAEIFSVSRNMADVLGGVLNLIAVGWDFGEKQRTQSKGQAMMELMDHYIVSHMDQVFSLQDLSESFHLSKAYVCRLFRDYKGMSFKDYTGKLKVDKAMELFRKGENVKNVSEYLGYMDPFYFSKVFKKRTGMSPTEYIRMLSVSTDTPGSF